MKISKKVSPLKFASIVEMSIIFVWKPFYVLLRICMVSRRLVPVKFLIRKDGLELVFGVRISDLSSF